MELLTCRSPVRTSLRSVSVCKLLWYASFLSCPLQSAFIGFKLISIVCSLHNMKPSIVTAQSLLTLCKATLEKLLPPPPEQHAFYNCTWSVLTVNQAWMTSKSLSWPWVEAQPREESCAAAVHTVPRLCINQERQSPAPQACSLLPTATPQPSLGLLMEKEKCVLAAAHAYSLRKVLSDRKKKTEEVKMNNYIII